MQFLDPQGLDINRGHQNDEDYFLGNHLEH